MRKPGICSTCTRKCSPMEWSRGIACRDYEKGKEQKDDMHKRK